MSGIAVLINGASAAGKSRLLRGLQQIPGESGVLRDVRIARRSTTRAARDAESLPGENEFLDPAEFERLVTAGTLDVHWQRRIAPGHTNHYGFSLAKELELGGVLVLSGNNYLDWRCDSLLRKLRDEQRLMVVRVHASASTRMTRLQARRPPLPTPEIRSRIDDIPAAMLPPADHVIPNDPGFERNAEWELVRLIAAFRFSTHATTIAA